MRTVEGREPSRPRSHGEYELKLHTLIFPAALAFVAIGPSAFAATTAHPTAAKVASWKLYFRSHSLGFPMVFRAHHPGPGWVLRRAKVLNLTPAQIKQEKMLAMGMLDATKSAVAVLQAKYAQYEKDAAQQNPSLQQITADVHAVGKAQTNVGMAMVPYHLKAYAALNPNQQAIFRTIVPAATMHH